MTNASERAGSSFCHSSFVIHPHARCANNLAPLQSRPRPARAAAHQREPASHEPCSRRASRCEGRVEHGVLRLPRLLAGGRCALRGLEHFRAHQSPVSEAVPHGGGDARRPARGCEFLDDVRWKTRARSASRGGIWRGGLARRGESERLLPRQRQRGLAPALHWSREPREAVHFSRRHRRRRGRAHRRGDGDVPPPAPWARRRYRAFRFPHHGRLAAGVQFSEQRRARSLRAANPRAVGIVAGRDRRLPPRG